MRRHQWLWLGVGMLTLAENSSGQKASNWRVYKLADRLPESACISVTVSPQGKVLARHFTLPFVSELDGYNVRTIPSPEIGRSRVYQSPGGQFWAVVPEGLQEFQDGSWVLHRVPELANSARLSSSRVIDPVPLYPVRQGLVLLLLAERLLEYNCEDPEHPQLRVLREANRTGLLSFSGLNPSRDGGLWICGQRGLAKIPGPIRNLKPDTEWSEHLIPESLHALNLQGLHEDEEGGIAAIADSSTNEQRLAVFFDGHEWSRQTAASAKLRYSWRSSDKKRWAMSTEALFESDDPRGELIENDEVSARGYFDVGVQQGSSFWLATSDGLFRYSPALWRPPAPVRRLTVPTGFLSGDSTGGLWLTAGGQVNSLQSDQLRNFPLPSLAREQLHVRQLFVLRNGSVVLALEDAEAPGIDAVFVLDTQAREFAGPMTPDPGQKLRALGMLKDGRICFQQLNGNGGNLTSVFTAFDGDHFEILSNPRVPSTPPDANWHTLYQAQNGDWWLSGDKGTALCKEDSWQTFPATADRSNPEDAVAFVEAPDGRIWCGAQDLVWEFDGRNWSVLRRGFDRINRMVRSRDGSIWIASNSGLFRYIQGAWIENGIEEGLPSSVVRDVYEDPKGRLWAATIRGVALFHPEADSDPPQTFVQTFPGQQNSVPEGGVIGVSFSGQDKWKYTPRERLLYSYRLDLRDWSAFQEATRVSFTDLPAGQHYFQVRAMDRNANIDPRPARREFVVMGPWYHETRLVLISAAGGLVALFFAGLAFNRHIRLSRSYAEIEGKVTERTHQLEVANRELLHSQKMNALGTLAAGIAHDFNNILSIIKGSTQIIEENLENPEKIRTRTDRIKLVVEQGAGIVKAMLGFSRDSGREPALCDVNEVVQDTLKLLGDRFLREVEVQSRATPDLPAVLAAKDLIQQILLNFIFNAAESMEGQKHITLSTGKIVELPGDLVLMPVPAASYVTVSVEDSGCGIVPENLPRIFEPFFTTKALSTRRGTGLGLSMVYELAKKMGSGLVVVSQVGRGSKFTLLLPVRQITSTG